MNELEESPLTSWAELSSLSDEELYQVFKSSTHSFPSPSALNGVQVRRIATDAVMRVGNLYDSEVLAMRLVSENTTITIPTIRRVFDMPVSRAMVLDYIPGKTLEECWPSLGLWRRLRISWTLRGYIRQLRRIQPRNTLRRIAFPGPFGSEPQMCYGPMFTEYGAGPFASYEELTDWFMHKLEVNRRIRNYPPAEDPMTFDASMPLVLTHLDIHPRNVLLSDDGRVWLIDWELAGFYPQWFEYIAMCGSWDIFGRWQIWALGLIAGFYERQRRFMASIGWALTTGILL
ncbi:kinase-like domain-containing protein [Lenzites betulinus]|nr:kinase-like domain-containing protein [Lenzites betulinus]